MLIFLSLQQVYMYSVSLSVEKCNAKLYLLRKLHPFVDAAIASQVYAALIQSSIDYCTPVWSSYTHHSIHQLQLIQSTATQCVLHLRATHQRPPYLPNSTS